VLTDLVEHYAYIASDKIEPAERFLKQVEKTFELISHFPGIGRAWESRRPRLAGVRVYPVPKFRNYLVFYRPIKAGVEILAVLHGARDLGSALDELSDEL
jgi:toxin ParE1/3/4